MPQPLNPQQIEAFLNSPGIDNCLTWRDWLKTVLQTLFREDEDFSGKHPLGNSGWCFHLAEALNKAYPELQIVYREDEDGEEAHLIDWKEAMQAFDQAVDYLMEPKR